MIDIAVKSIKKYYDENHIILDQLSFDVYEGEKIGLLGNNGAGKTTLFRILAGEIGYEEGSIAMPRGKRLGLLTQIPYYPEDYTVETVLETAFSHILEIRAKMHKIEQDMAEDASTGVLRRYADLTAQLEAADGYQTEVNKNLVCNGLGIPQDMREKKFALLSGGEQTRVNLARLILRRTDILLLDEPTNHLDMSSVEWLEGFLRGFKGTAVIVSHDRYFLDRVVTRIVELKNGKAEFYSGNYSFYVQEKQARYIEQLRRYEKEQKEIARLEAAANRMHQWAEMGNSELHKKAFTIETRMRRVGKTEKPDKQKAIFSRFSERAFSGDEVLVAAGLTKSYGDKTLFNDIELKVLGGERIGLLGDNGSGKTTLLGILQGDVSPDDGWARFGPAIKTGYMPQIMTFDNEGRNLVDTLIYGMNCSPQTARNRLGAFRFQGEDVFKQVSDLSGGERSRLWLCMQMARDINLLLLDEPTNHLDIESREWIEQAVQDFEGTLIFVSHDRYFVNRFATRIWELRDGLLYDFQGSYEQYLAYQEKIKEKQRPSEPESDSKPEKKAASTSRESAAAKKRAVILEGQISQVEGEIEELDREMERCASDFARLQQLIGEKKQLGEEMARLYGAWEQAMELAQGRQSGE